MLLHKGLSTSCSVNNWQIFAFTYICTSLHRCEHNVHTVSLLRKRCNFYRLRLRAVNLISLFTEQEAPEKKKLTREKYSQTIINTAQFLIDQLRDR